MSGKERRGEEGGEVPASKGGCWRCGGGEGGGGGGGGEFLEMLPSDRRLLPAPGVQVRERSFFASCLAQGEVEDVSEGMIWGDLRPPLVVNLPKSHSLASSLLSPTAASSVPPSPLLSPPLLSPPPSPVPPSPLASVSPSHLSPLHPYRARDLVLHRKFLPFPKLHAMKNVPRIRLPSPQPPPLLLSSLFFSPFLLASSRQLRSGYLHILDNSFFSVRKTQTEEGSSEKSRKRREATGDDRKIRRGEETTGK
eukprot:767929-Hanusia_phi.AAC.1